MQDQFTNSWSEMLNKLGGWVDAAILNLPNFFIAVVIFVIALFTARFLRSWVNKTMKRFVHQPSIRDLIATISSVVIIAIGLLLALSVLNLGTALKSILAGAGVIGLAIGLAVQGPLSNTFSGIFLAVRDVINVGDWVESNGYQGTVTEINLRNTRIKESDNNVVVIPNSMIIENPFKNYGLTSRIRTTIECGVSYDSDLEEVKQIAIEAIKNQFPTDQGEEIEFYYREFGGSSIDFMMRFWVDATAKISALEAKSKAIITIKKAFDKHNIDIPFPIRTVYSMNGQEKEEEAFAN